MKKLLKQHKLRTCALALCTGLLGGCASQALPPIKTVDQVEIDRFMGDWYVIASIPTLIEKDAYNAVESYRRNSDGSIATTFTLRKGGFDGEQKTYQPKGFVRDNTGNAVWGMQFVWPIKAEYLIAYLDDDYQRTVIARNARDYVWIMARTPSITDEHYAELTKLVGELGYDLGKVRLVPQQWLTDHGAK